MEVSYNKFIVADSLKYEIYSNKVAFYSLLAVSFFVVILTHLTPYPVYLFEPIRVILISIIFIKDKKIILSLVLVYPFINYLFTLHPSLYKTILIVSELFLNFSLFYYLLNVLKNSFFAMFVSILVSKLVYYILKYLLTINYILNGEIISTPIIIQFFVSVFLSLYTYYISLKTQNYYVK